MFLPYNGINGPVLSQLGAGVLRILTAEVALWQSQSGLHQYASWRPTGQLRPTAAGKGAKGVEWDGDKGIMGQWWGREEGSSDLGGGGFGGNSTHWILTLFLGAIYLHGSTWALANDWAAKGLSCSYWGLPPSKGTKVIPKYPPMAKNPPQESAGTYFAFLCPIPSLNAVDHTIHGKGRLCIGFRKLQTYKTDLYLHNIDISSTWHSSPAPTPSL